MIASTKRILTTMEAMIKYKLFRANSTIRNLGLVLALLIRSIGSTSQIGGSKPSHNRLFDDGLCLYNENGWASVVVELAQAHGVSIHGIEEGHRSNYRGQAGEIKSAQGKER